MQLVVSPWSIEEGMETGHKVVTSPIFWGKAHCRHAGANFNECSKCTINIHSTGKASASTSWAGRSIWNNARCMTKEGGGVCMSGCCGVVVLGPLLGATGSCLSPVTQGGFCKHNFTQGLGCQQKGKTWENLRGQGCGQHTAGEGVSPP